jgi:uncharacterized lipoprotein
MTRTWILGPLTVILLAGCGGGAPQQGQPAGGAGTETGSPGMTSDTTAGAPAPGAIDTAAPPSGADTAPAGGMTKDTTDTTK